ncbi:hypothetical protein FHS29_004683 [Saccharothrix tamanrassetensis]|uniref:Uncharacterized protein n=1 Tax=Saccharothrix tamanrassetensis TaxID=1051531 RepID=A0A841CQ00_9PSEU|nr:rhomboid-like protein [Saccharothrix tamanrassetensis]MBB5958075.1 hypothetical protein [Saccharothrix tamanrassetensis]
MRRTAEVLRRLPFTVSVVVVMLVVGVASGALWTDAVDEPWYPEVAFGVPSLAEGRWWTPVTGSFLAIVPAAYVPMTGTFALFVGLAEWRLGTRFTAVVAVVGQLGAVLLGALLLVLLRWTGWDWAERTAGALDVGFSAGALWVAALLSASVPPPWRLRVRLGLAVYAVGSFAFLGSLADVEHLVAVVAGLAVGPVLDGRVPRREALLLAFGVPVVVVAVGFALGALLPAQGPLGDTSRPSTVLLGILVVLVVAPLPAFGARRGVS